MGYQPVLHTTAERELNSLPDSDESRITSLIKDVCQHRQPSQHSKIRHLEGHKGLYRLREGNVRAILTLEKPELVVLKVGKRDGVYDDIDDIDQRLSA